jgi:hypothetical protein
MHNGDSDAGALSDHFLGGRPELISELYLRSLESLERSLGLLVNENFITNLVAALMIEEVLGFYF